MALDFLGDLWRDHRRLSCREQEFDHTPVSVNGLVCQLIIGRHLRQQRIGALQIMGLARRQHEGQRIAQSINKSMYLGAQPVCAAPDRFVYVHCF